MRPLFSIISPVYRAEAIVDQLVTEIIAQVSQLTDHYEIILVEDASPDQSWARIEAICGQYPQVKGIQLSRNFGQHYAITAGLEHARGQWVVVMDCDLQDRPDEIPNLYAKAQEGYDLVFAQRIDRQDSPLKRLSSWAFYSVFSYLTGTKQDASVANFGIYHRKVVRAILSMRDHIRYFPTMSKWVGFKAYYLPVKHSERKEGKSSYTWSKLFRLAFDNIIAFSDRPLWLTVKFGAFIVLFSMAVGLYYLIKFLMGEILLPGYTSLILSVWFLSGVLMAALGMVGIYVGKTFEKAKGRPLYIVRQELNTEKTQED